MKKIIAMFLIMLCLPIYSVSADNSKPNNINDFDVETFTVASFDLENGTVSYKNYDTTETTQAKRTGIIQLSTPASFSETSDALIENNNITSRAIVGEDVRQQITNPQNVSPYKAICKILAKYDIDGDGDIDETYSGTAFMEGASIAVTNAHVVYSSDYNMRCKSIEIIPAKSGDNNPFGVIGAKKLHICTAWVEEFDPNEDWAVIELDSPVGKQTGWLGKMWTSGTLNGTIVNTTGYPGDKPVHG